MFKTLCQGRELGQRGFISYICTVFGALSCAELCDLSQFCLYSLKASSLSPLMPGEKCWVCSRLEAGDRLGWAVWMVRGLCSGVTSNPQGHDRADVPIS